MLFRYLHYMALLCLTLSMAGCGLFATKQQPDTPVHAPSELMWQEHQKKISQLNGWQVDGKVGIKTKADSGSASLFWLQQTAYYDIRLAGPFGRGATRIVGNANHVTIEIAGQGRYSANTPEELLKQQLNWDLPVSHLAWWIKGLPAPESPFANTLDNDSRLADLRQDNWTIQYHSYQEVEGYWLPRRIVAESADMKITLVIKQWTLRHIGNAIAKN